MDNSLAILAILIATAQLAVMIISLQYNKR
jgi:hypothetical protein